MNNDQQNIVIERVKLKHIPDIIPLMQKYFNFYRVQPPPVKNLEELIRTLISDPSKGRQYIAYSDGIPVGFTTLYISMSTLTASEVVVMNDLFVKTENRNLGIGKLLFETAFNFTTEHYYPKMEWMTEPVNSKARAFYDKLGGHGSEWIYYEKLTKNNK